MVVRVLFVGVIGVIRGQKKDDIFSLRTSSEKDVILFFAFLFGKRCHLLVEDLFGKDDIFSLYLSSEKDDIFWLRDSSPTFTSIVVYLKHNEYIC